MCSDICYSLTCIKLIGIVNPDLMFQLKLSAGKSCPALQHVLEHILHAPIYTLISRVGKPHPVNSQCSCDNMIMFFIIELDSKPPLKLCECLALIV
jgi:hypothetical protein